MSLVHQALRKAEQEKHRKTGRPPAALPERVLPPPPAGAKPAAGAPPPVQPPSRRRLPLVLALIVALGIVLAAFAVIRPTPSTPPPSASAPSVAATPSADPAPAPAAPAPTTSADDARFTLTGITQLPDGESAAVINGQLRSVNQYIDGAIVKRIEVDRVTLDVEGREVVKRLF